MVKKSTHDTRMPIDSRYALVGVGLQQLACDEFLHGQHHAIFTPDSDCRSAVLDRLDCVFDLKVAAIGRKDGVGEIVARTYRGLFGDVSSVRDPL